MIWTILISILLIAVISVSFRYTRILQFVRLLGSYIWLYFPCLFSVALCYFLLTAVPQGIDVLMIAGESVSAFIFTLLAVILLSGIIWYTGHLVGSQKQNTLKYALLPASAGPLTNKPLSVRQNASTQKWSEILLKHIPIICGFNIIICLEVAILNLPSILPFSSSFLLLTYIIWSNLLYCAIYLDFTNRSSRFLKAIILVSFAVIGLIFTLIFIIHKSVDLINIISGANRHIAWLLFLGFLLNIFKILYLYVVMKFYRKKSETRTTYKMVKNDYLNNFLSGMGVGLRFNVFVAFNIICLIALILYTLIVFSMRFSQLTTTLPFFLLAVGILTGIVNFLVVINIINKVNIFGFMLLAALIIGYFTTGGLDPYKVRTIVANKPLPYSQRVSTQNYLTEFLKQRIRTLQNHPTYSNSNTRYDLYLVLSNGGASRSGKWTTEVLGAIQDSSYKLDKTNPFRDHILAIAGASGGSVGNCAFYGLMFLENAGKITGDKYYKNANTFFKGDFLTATLGRMLGTDILKHIIPLNFIQNRADILEKSVETNFTEPILANIFSKPFHEVTNYGQSKNLPILFINSTRVQDGIPCIISSVQLPVESQRIDVLNKFDQDETNQPGDDIRFSTAAILSARFPYVSPAGKIGGDYLVDGGYFDNSGAGIMFDLIAEYNNLILSDSFTIEEKKYLERIDLYVLHITNSESVQPIAQQIHPLVNDLATPIKTLIGIYGASTVLSTDGLTKGFKKKNTLINFSLYDTGGENSQHCAVPSEQQAFPMSWVISEYQQNRMHKALQRQCCINFSKIPLLNSTKTK